MGQQHRLRMLEMSPPRHRCLWVRFGLVCQCLAQREHVVTQTDCLIVEEHLEQSGDLVVARAPGSQPTAQFGANFDQQESLQGAMDVLIAGVWLERACLELGS